MNILYKYEIKHCQKKQSAYNADARSKRSGAEKMEDFVGIPYDDAVDAKLIELATSGDQEARLEIRNRYNTRLYLTAMAMLDSLEKAEQAVEATWEHAWKELHEFKHESLFLTWICRRLMKHIINNFLKSE